MGAPKRSTARRSKNTARRAHPIDENTPLTLPPDLPLPDHLTRRRSIAARGVSVLVVLAIFAAILYGGVKVVEVVGKGYFSTSNPAGVHQTTVHTDAPKQQAASSTVAKQGTVAASVTPSKVVQPQISQRIAPDPANADLKAFQPALERLVPVVQHYTEALDACVTASKKIIQELKATTQAPDTVRLYQSDPDAVQAIINRECSASYSLFQKFIRENLEMIEDKDIHKTLMDVAREVNQRPASPLKIASQRIIERCNKAQSSLETYRARQRYELAEKMQQINEAPEKLLPIADELREELRLLKSPALTNSP
jgi:hypothetical protein